MTRTGNYAGRLPARPPIMAANSWRAFTPGRLSRRPMATRFRPLALVFRQPSVAPSRPLIVRSGDNLPVTVNLHFHLMLQLFERLQRMVVRPISVSPATGPAIQASQYVDLSRVTGTSWPGHWSSTATDVFWLRTATTDRLGSAQGMRTAGLMQPMSRLLRLVALGRAIDRQGSGSTDHGPSETKGRVVTPGVLAAGPALGFPLPFGPEPIRRAPVGGSRQAGFLRRLYHRTRPRWRPDDRMNTAHPGVAFRSWESTPAWPDSRHPGSAPATNPLPATRTEHLDPYPGPDLGRVDDSPKTVTAKPKPAAAVVWPALARRATWQSRMVDARLAAGSYTPQDRLPGRFNSDQPDRAEPGFSWRLGGVAAVHSPPDPAAAGLQRSRSAELAPPLTDGRSAAGLRVRRTLFPDRQMHRPWHAGGPLAVPPLEGGGFVHRAGGTHHPPAIGIQHLKRGGAGPESDHRLSAARSPIAGDPTPIIAAASPAFGDTGLVMRSADGPGRPPTPARPTVPEEQVYRTQLDQERSAATPYIAAGPAGRAPQIDLDRLDRDLWERFEKRIRVERQRRGRA